MRDRLRKIAASYANGQDRPLGGYIGALTAYSTVTAAAAVTAVATRRRIPTPGLAEVALVGVATHKLSRLITKDTVAAPLRAPFTRFAEAAGNGEVNEEVRGHGAQHAVGEMITCPFCVSVWVATGLSIGMVFAPKLTRLVATTFTAVAASDFLQLAYASAERPPTDSSGDLRIPIVTSIEFVCRLGHGSREGDASDRR